MIQNWQCIHTLQTKYTQIKYIPKLNIPIDCKEVKINLMTSTFLLALHIFCGLNKIEK